MPIAENLSLDALRAFVAFAEHLNFTHAAEALDISQPALHVKIRDLSRLLGCALYVKRGRVLSLTEQGHELVRFGREVQDRVEGFCISLGTPSDRPVTVVAGAGAYRYLLGSSLKAFLVASKVPLSLLTDTAENALAAIEEGRVDLAVTVWPQCPAGLTRRLLRRVGYVVALPRQHPLSRKRSLTVRDLRGIPLVVPPRPRPHRLMLDAHLDALHVGVEAEGWDLILHFVALGLGCAVVNDTCDIPRSIVTRPISGLPSTAYHVYYRKLYLRPPAGQLLSLMLETAS